MVIGFAQMKIAITVRTGQSIAIPAKNGRRGNEYDYCQKPYGEESFFRDVLSLTKWDFENIPVEKRYPPGAETFAELFCVHLRPILKEESQTM